VVRTLASESIIQPAKIGYLGDSTSGASINSRESHFDKSRIGTQSQRDEATERKTERDRREKEREERERERERERTREIEKLRNILYQYP